ncbi:MAG: hypothetical protein ACRC20_08870 [Segniliparus sp.]|uniref:hypothetical protein n=1 Tax=Segniliparus sp. TaxID=2804064 RepID=UPI003F40E11A
MTAPVIGADDPGPPPWPILWAKPPVRPEPIDPDSLDSDKLTALLDRSSPQGWRFWPLYGSFCLLMQILTTAQSKPWRHQGGTSAAGTAGFGLYIAVSLLFIALVAAAIKATRLARPRLRRNQLLGMCASVLALAAALPWQVLLWGGANTGIPVNTGLIMWPVLLGLPLAIPPQTPSKGALRALRDIPKPDSEAAQ